MNNPDSAPFLAFSTADLESLRGKDGGAFRSFMQGLIRAHMAATGVPETEFTSDAKNMTDGGVDAELRAAASAVRDVEGFFDKATVWQFKGTAATFSDIYLRGEIQKPYAQQRIRDGFRYVFCIAAEMTPKKVAAWEKILDAERNTLNPAAPSVRVFAESLRHLVHRQD